MARIIHTAGLDISGSIFTQVQNNLTASLSISASNDIIADKFIIDKGAATGSSFQVAGDGVLLLSNKAGGQLNKVSIKASEIDDSNGQSSLRIGGSTKFGNAQGATDGSQTGIHFHEISGSAGITGSLNVNGEAGHVTASGNISASGDLKAGKLFIDDKAAIDLYSGIGNELTLNPDATWDAIRLQRDGSPKPIILNGNVTASIISASLDIQAQKFISKGKTVISYDANTDATVVNSSTNNIFLAGNITASSVGKGNISASGDIFAKNITAIGTVTAHEFHTQVVSASIIFHSGSTKFGDTTDDRHLFTGSVDITGDLKAGKLFIDEKAAIDTYVGLGNELTLNPDNTWDAIRLNRDGAPQPIILNGFVTASRTMTIGSSANSESDRIFEVIDNEGGVRIFYESQKLLQLGANEPVVRMGGSSTQFQLTGSMVTSNGDISASGDITGDTGSFNRVFVTHAPGRSCIVEFNGNSFIGGNAQSGNDLLLSANDDIFFGSADDVIFYSASLPDGDVPSDGAQWLNFDNGTRTLTFGPAANKFVFSGNITASGDISASGHLAVNEIRSHTDSINNGFTLFASNADADSSFPIFQTRGDLDGVQDANIKIGDTAFIDTGANLEITINSGKQRASFNAMEIAVSRSIEVKGGTPVTTHTTSPISSSNANAGKYHIVGGNLTCSIANFSGQVPHIGAEWTFFQTSSAGNFLFESGSGITVISKNESMRLAQLGSSAVLKKVASTTFHIMGDLT